MGQSIIRRVIAVGCGVALVAGTQSSCANDSPVAAARDPADLRRADAPRPVERVPPAPLQVAGEAPAEILARVRADASGRAGVRSDETQVLRDQSVTWNDGSLGCPRPGEIYTQALVPGYWIVLLAAGHEYDYRVNSQGMFRLCDNALPVAPSPARPAQ